MSNDADRVWWRSAGRSDIWGVAFTVRFSRRYWIVNVQCGPYYATVGWLEAF